MRKQAKGGVVRGNCSSPLRCDPSALPCALSCFVFCASAMLLRPVRALVAPCVFLPTAGCRLWFRTAFFWRAPTNRMGNREAKKSPIVEGKRILARPLARKKKRAWGALSFHKKDEKGACWFAFDRYKGSSQCVQMGKKEQHTTIWIPAVRKKGGGDVARNSPKRICGASLGSRTVPHILGQFRFVVCVALFSLIRRICMDLKRLRG